MNRSFKYFILICSWAQLSFGAAFQGKILSQEEEQNFNELHTAHWDALKKTQKIGKFVKILDLISREFAVSLTFVNQRSGLRVIEKGLFTGCLCASDDIGWGFFLARKGEPKSEPIRTQIVFSMQYSIEDGFCTGDVIGNLLENRYSVSPDAVRTFFRALRKHQLLRLSREEPIFTSLFKDVFNENWLLLTLYDFYKETFDFDTIKSGYECASEGSPPSGATWAWTESIISDQETSGRIREQRQGCIIQ